MRTITAVLKSCALCLLVFLLIDAQPVPLARAGESSQATTTEVTREDIFIPHVSTVPANAGQTVGISVRHVTQKDRQPTRGPVLFTNPGFTSSLTVFDLDYKTYSITAALAEQGFDVYLMDHTGFGRSPRPTMDDPCNVDRQQPFFGSVTHVSAAVFVFPEDCGRRLDRVGTPASLRRHLRSWHSRRGHRSGPRLRRPGAAMWGRPPGTFYRVANGTQVDAGWNRMSRRG
jgi:hypothetical protein